MASVELRRSNFLRKKRRKEEVFDYLRHTRTSLPIWRFLLEKQKFIFDRWTGKFEFYSQILKWGVAERFASTHPICFWLDWISRNKETTWLIRFLQELIILHYAYHAVGYNLHISAVQQKRFCVQQCSIWFCNCAWFLFLFIVVISLSASSHLLPVCINGFDCPTVAMTNVLSHK